MYTFSCLDDGNKYAFDHSSPSPSSNYLFLKCSRYTNIDVVIFFLEKKFIHSDYIHLLSVQYLDSHTLRVEFQQIILLVLTILDAIVSLPYLFPFPLSLYVSLRTTSLNVFQVNRWYVVAAWILNTHLLPLNG